MKTANYYETDTHIYFYGSIYSQWAGKSFILDKTLFDCCEQYMMYRKANLFGDKESALKIWSTGDPAKQKALGRKVKNFDKDKWEAIAKDVVYEANYAKFTQNEDCLKELMASGDKIIVEASPYDCIWGIGMSCDDPGITDPKNWRGTNWLGEAIMKVRENIRKQEKENDK
jgi:ribA/ribD-fused uncharacterized protein